MSKYTPVEAGIREIAQSSAMGAATLGVAQQLAGNANAVGHSEYESEGQTVTAGWANDRRAGAVVRESVTDGRDWRDAVLLRVRDAMSVRGGR